MFNIFYFLYIYLVPLLMFPNSNIIYTTFYIIFLNLKFVLLKEPYILLSYPWIITDEILWSIMILDYQELKL